MAATESVPTPEEQGEAAASLVTYRSERTATDPKLIDEVTEKVNEGDRVVKAIDAQRKYERDMAMPDPDRSPRSGN